MGGGWAGMGGAGSVSLPAVGVLLREDPQHELGFLVRPEGGRDDDVTSGWQLEAPGDLAVVDVGARASGQQQRIARGPLLVQGPEVGVLQPQGDRKLMILSQGRVHFQSSHVHECNNNSCFFFSLLFFSFFFLGGGVGGRGDGGGYH